MTEQIKQQQNQQRPLSRRDMLKSTAALAATAAIPGCGGGGSSDASTNKPNILFVMVDEMRFPKVFPPGVNTPAEYLQKFMPNVYRLWEGGVKFANHHSAATACSPSRGAIVTGLYSHQTWFGTTLVVIPGKTQALSPSLQPGFPTYGKLLREAGYITPYMGKWHCSQPDGPTQELNNFGFQGLTYPDPIANNLQGTYGDMSDPDNYYFNDEYIATQAVTWLKEKRVGDQPWCLTVSFQNPHDFEFFPSGTEFQTYTNYYANSSANPLGLAQHSNWSEKVCVTPAQQPWPNLLTSPPSYYTNYEKAPNWESQEAMTRNKPKAQILNRQFCQLLWGGIGQTPDVVNATIVPYPYDAASKVAYPTYVPPVDSNRTPYGIVISPYSYWQKGLNLYTYIQTLLDKQIGRVLDSMTPEVLKNTVVVFTADHGDYAGAHGIVAGKTFTMYEEALHVPLIVKDPTGTFTGNEGVVRDQLTSSVDLMPMLVGFAYGGQKGWMQGDYAQMYGTRCDMFPILKSADARGREHALFATDETLLSTFDFATPPNAAAEDQKTPIHIVAVITKAYKLGVYSNWVKGTTIPILNGQEYEYYDYTTESGRQEISNTYGSGHSVEIKNHLVEVLVPTELQAPLPAAYQSTQAYAKRALEIFNRANETSGRE